MFDSSIGVGRAVLDDNLTFGLLAVEDDPLIFPHRPADDIVIEQAVKDVTLPLRVGRCRPERLAWQDPLGLVDPFVKGSGEVTKRPEILGIGRLIQ